MLGVEAPENKEEINFPVIASYKLDGIRCIFHPELGMVSRSLKPIKNKQLQEKYKYLIDSSRDTNTILDGELYNHDLTFQQITSLVMTEDFEDEKTFNKLLKNDPLGLLNAYNYELDGYMEEFTNPLKFHIFDFLMIHNLEVESFERHYDYNYIYSKDPNVNIVNQKEIYDYEELDEMFKEALNKGYEGLIIKKLDGKYKFGRSTKKEGLLLKYKPFVTYDAKIFAIIERFKNTNESFKNELGESTKRNTVDAKEPTGIASAFIVKWDKVVNNSEGYAVIENHLKVTLNGTEDFRREIWKNKDKYEGKMIEFKGMDVGAKEVPRHPVFVRFREDK